MFGPVQTTRYDLAFPLGSIPVRVVPTFWLTAALLGFSLTQDADRGLTLLLIWIGVVFVSVLVHEMGHALVAAMFGYQPRILLYHFGGLAMFEPYHDYSTVKSILISLAGPAAGFFLGMLSIGIVFVAGLNGAPADALWLEAAGMAIWVNIGWTVLNLMPIIPLDGGQVIREVCLAASPRSGMSVALWISVVAGVLIGLGAIVLQEVFLALMFLMLAGQNFQEVRQRQTW